MIGLYIGLGVLVALIVAVILIYNNAAKKKLRVDNAFSQIKIQCKKRAELVPFLADVVKSAVKSEGGTIVPVAFSDPKTAKDLADAQAQTAREVSYLYGLAEANPGLRTNAHFLQLTAELTKSEKAIAVSRGFYNDAVMMYNRTVRLFPFNLIAKMFRLKPVEFLDEMIDDSVIRGAVCPSCGAVSNSPICAHCGTRIPLL